MILNRGGVEHHDVSEHAFGEATTFFQAEVFCRKSRQASNRLSDRDDLLVPDVLSKPARKVAVGTRVRIRGEKRTLGGNRSSVRREAHPRKPQLLAQVIL